MRRLALWCLVVAVPASAATAWAASGAGTSGAEETGYTLLVFYVTLALLVSFLCSVFEAVLLSVTPAYIGSLEQEGKAAGARIRRLKEENEALKKAVAETVLDNQRLKKSLGL